MEPEPRFEYAVSVGEGTLLAYGVLDDDMPAPMSDEQAEMPGFAIILGLAADDCVTGQ